MAEGHVICGFMPLLMNLQEYFFPLAESILFLFENGHLRELASWVHLRFLLAKISRVCVHCWCCPRSLPPESQELLPILLIQVLEQALGSPLSALLAIESVLILTLIGISSSWVEFLTLGVHIAVLRGKRGLIQRVVVRVSRAGTVSVIRKSGCVGLQPAGASRF